ncbi:penicillin-binding protein 2 [bacterium]|nr:penicillin-binding protein 2 [bacterium]
MNRSRTRTRALIVVGALVLAVAGLAFRLFQLQVLLHDELTAEVDRIHARVVHRLGRRGAILDCKGNLLANSLSTYVVTADPSLTRGRAVSAARQLAPLLAVDEVELVNRLSRKGRYVRLQKRVGDQTADQVRALRIKGIHFEDQFTRSYPNGVLASHVVGFVNAEHRGVQGIEAVMDEYLKGRPGYEVIERDRKGREIRALRNESISPRPGYTVVLTIDQVIQHIAETELEKAMAAHRPQAGIIIVSRPATGEILAMTCRPTYDPNRPGDVPADARRNRAISDVAEPGSTFKVATIAGALQDGLVTPADRFDCENGAFIYAGRALHDAHPYGMLSVDEILYHSSNIGAAKVALRAGPHRVHRYVRGFGFGAKTGIALLGEVSGIVHPLSQWTKLSITRIPMGHEIAVTSLQMLLAMNSVANGGRLMRPLIIKGVIEPSGAPVLQYAPQLAGRPILPRTSLMMTASLRKVVTPEGTARRAAVPGYDVAGKTGTAQKIENGQYVRKFYSSFIGYLPAGDPQISILVTLDDPTVGGYYGGTVAGPVFREVAAKVAQYLGIPPQPPTGPSGEVS